MYTCLVGCIHANTMGSRLRDAATPASISHVPAPSHKRGGNNTNNTEVYPHNLVLIGQRENERGHSDSLSSSPRRLIRDWSGIASTRNLPLSAVRTCTSTCCGRKKDEAPLIVIDQGIPDVDATEPPMTVTLFNTSL